VRALARHVVGIAAGLGLVCLPSSAFAAATITEYPVTTHNRQPLGIAAGPDGNVWFTQSVTPGGIGRSSLTGQITEFSSGLTGGAQGIAPGPDGNLWFVEPSAAKVGRITTGGTIKEFPTAAGSEPSMITAGPDGNMWFTEAGGKGAIGRITTSGTITLFTTGLTQNSEPEDITAGPDGNLWFTESSSTRSGVAIGRIDPTPPAVTRVVAVAHSRKAIASILVGCDETVDLASATNVGFYSVAVGVERTHKLVFHERVKDQ
jgi:streptogramin lyase